ncbi:MAG: HAD hydrolase family protein [Acidobacteriota bacterium]|jgi:3-deoxy-D-manno-octulosonate 8-phosphate phosphatase, YrbI family|nr:HAD hydrolase family protein [Acidobacteriota bacterium]OQB56831.1 MAG: 3-deoxy-D-manno-octulosonate 8-phosphate phosphatase KdsC [Candidatus Aminicenantes bacterium ADurb.Bin147]HNQ81360.1 HAD hydrolase family protein [Candidatus Aminicenantes bacterium]MDD8011268.1 HAD hydrolase family protein [Acidobacteriota bacterium]MDD8030014.1 HAD hydrolase family protein [Acidobacteriota bacterium]
MGKRGRARRVRMILADVDGTLTDGSLTPYPDGEEIKSFNTKDGLGVLISRLAGLKVGFITGKNSKALEGRAARLRIDELRQGAIDKEPVFREILAKHGLRPEEIAYIGDDLNDLAVLEAAGFSAAPADAVAAVRKRVDFVCRRRGGEGAFRELVDYILGAQRKWSLVKDRFREISDHKI